MLVGAVVIAAIADGGFESVRAVPGAHQVVAGGLGRRIRAGWFVRAELGEFARFVQSQIAIHFVGAMWWNRISWRRAASSNTYVPVTFVLRNGEASRIELSLCDSAASAQGVNRGTAAAERWFSPESRDSTSSASQILPCTKVRFAAARHRDSRACRHT